MKNILCGTAALALTLLAACAGTDDSSRAGDPVASVASAIVNGVDDTTAHDSVVLVLYEPKGKIVSSCTGTLVAPNLVLTARHCVSETDESLICKADGTAYEGGKISADDAPSAFYIYPGLNAIPDVTSSAKPAAHGKVIVTETTSVLCDHDVAFIVLDADIDYPTAPLRTTSGAVAGEKLTAVGWGLTETGKLPSTRQSRDGVKVLVSGPYIQDTATGIGIGDSEFAVAESICAGDSGGPAFSTKGAVVGVVSRGGNGTDPTTNQASSCVGANTTNVYTDLAKKSALVTKAFAAAGYAVREEGTAPGIANGETCSADADCNSLECVASVCVTRCDDSTAAACGNGQTCSDKDSVKVCLTPSQVTALAASISAAASASSKSTTSDGGGCAAAPRTTGGSFGAGLLVGLSLLMLRRRSGGRARGVR